MTTPNRTIAIDFDIHKMIETNRRGFEETENTVLRRLLRLPESPTTDSPGAVAEGHNGVWAQQSSVRSWRSKGVELPEGTKFRLVHPRANASGSIRNGKWDIAGETFGSPSRAAGFAVKKDLGRRISLNGWISWEVLPPGESEWSLLNSLRDQSKIERRWR